MSESGWDATTDRVVAALERIIDGVPRQAGAKIDAALDEMDLAVADLIFRYGRTSYVRRVEAAWVALEARNEKIAALVVQTPNDHVLRDRLRGVLAGLE